MAWRNTAVQWGTVSRLLHWSMAILIVVDIYLVWYITNQDFENFREQSTLTFRAIMPWHKALGFFVLPLFAVRVAWRRSDVRPPLPATMKKWERGLATGTHHLIYLLIPLSAVTGWGRVSANGSIANVFDWFVLPPLVAKDEGWYSFFAITHDWTSWGLLALAAFHAAAGIKHHFVDRDTVLKSMLPFVHVDPAADPKGS